MQTPWGPSQSIRVLGQVNGEDILEVTTAGHGGIFVPPAVLHLIPTHRRKRAAQWSGNDCWYEEDCEWASVALAMPRLFTTRQVELARRIEAGRPRASEHDFDPTDCGGAYDGTSVHSDADPGL